MEAHPNVVLFVTDNMSFPEGMAGTCRAKLIAQAMSLAGHEVEILVVLPPEYDDSATHDTKGEWRGVRYHYTYGMIRRPAGLIHRRIRSAWGLLYALARICMYRSSNRRLVVYLWMNHWQRSSRLRWTAVRTVAHLCGGRVIAEINEPPKTMWGAAPSSLPAPPDAWLVRRTDGFVSISRRLSTWLIQAQIPEQDVLELPILVDLETEGCGAVGESRGPYVWSGGKYYAREMLPFMLEVVHGVVRRRPRARFIFTGWEHGSVDDREISARLGDWIDSGVISVVGKLERDELRAVYRDASALLLPMEPDLRSQFRAPTKLGEYLASGRPVVVTDVGEVGRLLNHQKSAFLCRAGSVDSMVSALCDIESRPALATAVGAEGRCVAQRCLDFHVHAARIDAFLKRIAKRDRSRATTPTVEDVL